MIESLLLVISLNPQSRPSQTFQITVPGAGSAASACAETLRDRTDVAGPDICLGEEQLRLGSAAPRGATDQLRYFEAAVDHFRRAAIVTSKADTKVRALDALVQLYDAQHLKQPEQAEPVLRELIQLKPDDFAVVQKLSRVQEDRGLFDAAEQTLVVARHQRPEAVETYKALAQFYARRVTALNQIAEAEKPAPPASNPGEPDQYGVYHAGGGIQPIRSDRPIYPAQALAAGIAGVVTAEVVINESGDVVDARVIQSVPLLDDEALRAVRNWHFVPTMVSGQAVPVRLTVTVNFSTR